MNRDNAREHWRARYKRSGRERGLVCMKLTAEMRAAREAIELPIVVTLTRIAPSNGLDDDGLRSALKSVRDGVAGKHPKAPSFLHVDDNDPRIEWRYLQERGRPKEYAVRIEVSTTKGRA